MAYPNYYIPNYGGYAMPQIPQMAQTAQQMPQQMQLPQIPQNQNGGINWVQGEAGAKAFPVAPGASVLLMDSEAKTMYLKGADQNGIPSMRIFDYTERISTVGDNLSAIEQKYVTREELAKLVKAVKGINEKMTEGKTDEQSDL